MADSFLVVLSVQADSMTDTPANQNSNIEWRTDLSSRDHASASPIVIVRKSSPPAGNSAAPPVPGGHRFGTHMHAMKSWRDEINCHGGICAVDGVHTSTIPGEDYSCDYPHGRYQRRFPMAAEQASLLQASPLQSSLLQSSLLQ